MTKRITKYVADDGTEFLKKGDAEVFGALKIACGALDLNGDTADQAKALLQQFDIKPKKKG